MNKIVAKTYEKLRLLYGKRFSEYYKDSDKKVSALYLKHLLGKCFIIGTGPSLNNTNLSLLKDEILFGVNNFDADKFGIKPQYWVVADADIFDKNYGDLLCLDTVLFLTNGAGQFFLHNIEELHNNLRILFKEKPIVLRPLSDMKSTAEFSRNIKKGVNGGMVIYSCLQIAYYMGFKEVYLVGCDCSSKGKHYDTSIDRENDNDYWSHFFKLYEVCKRVYGENGRKIYNATVGGNLEVFERRNLEDVV